MADVVETPVVGTPVETTPEPRADHETAHPEAPVDSESTPVTPVAALETTETPTTDAPATDPVATDEPAETPEDEPPVIATPEPVVEAAVVTPAASPVAVVEPKTPITPEVADPASLPAEAPMARVTVEAISPSDQLLPGQVREYHFRVVNTGEAAVTVRVSVANGLPGWSGQVVHIDGALPDDSVTIEPGQNLRVVVAVGAPKDSRQGDRNTTELVVSPVEAA